MSTRWIGTKMWTFGPVTRTAKTHLTTSADFPPRGDEGHVKEQVASEGGMSQ
ncbi:hypothetical protein [Shimia sagamensis]|uniref:Uncharacterized protein n=1 Tax=Shimia sagamensis TaxID=1566352 RepID=A0ABY1P1W5_9RHOB|nr:hypothetical protein [Shimia sagamensis]SMP22936.1 hypothetical protein SAMN06265373_104287 [Shimia sagamensis]